MHVLWFEFTLALRRLARRPGQNGLLLVTYAVSVTLALLSWSLFHTVNLSRPDFDPHGDYYVLAYDGALAVDINKSTHEEMEAYKAQQTVFSDVVELGFYDSSSVKTPDGYERSLGAWMSSRALQLTGAKPLLGTLFTPADDTFRAPEKVLLSERLWTTGFGRDPDIVGKPIEISGDPGTIVGVMPASYRFPNDQDYWISYGAAFENPRYPVRAALVKLKPGISQARAESDLQAIQASFPATSPSKVRGARVALLNFRDLYLLPDMRMSSMILLALALLFVAVSCANAANLMIIDFLGRRPEVAATLALGIPRRAAIRNVCWQVALIALGSTAVALALLPVAGPLLFDRVKVIMAPYWLVYHFAWNDVAVALLISGLAAAVTVSAPIAYLLLVDPDKVIRENASAVRGTGRGLWRRLLLIGQIALLTVLGVGAGLLVRSNRNVGESHWGYDAARVFNGKITVDAISYPGHNWSVGRLASLRQAFQPIRQRPETAFAAYSDQPPGYSNGPYCTYAIDPQVLANGMATGEAFSTRISDQFFATLEVPFVAGEDFPADPPDGGPPDAILTQSLANRLWPHEDPIHRTLYVHYPWMKAGTPPMQLTVRGVVRDFQTNGPRARTNDAIYLPYRKLDGAGTTIHIFVRDQSGMPTFKSLSDAVHRGEMRAALYFPSTVKRQIDLMLSSMRMTADLTSVFALVAVILCAIGVYSLTVAQVLQSAREFGIRMALGAEPVRLWRDFTRGHLLTALLGVGLGLVGAWQLARVLGALLYGVDPHGLATYAGVAAAILLVASLACAPSLFQLRRINPADCLRTL